MLRRIVAFTADALKDVGMPADIEQDMTSPVSGWTSSRPDDAWGRVMENRGAGSVSLLASPLRGRGPVFHAVGDGVLADPTDREIRDKATERVVMGPGKPASKGWDPARPEGGARGLKVGRIGGGCGQVLGAGRPPVALWGSCGR